MAIPACHAGQNPAYRPSAPIPSHGGPRAGRSAGARIMGKYCIRSLFVLFLIASGECSVVLLPTLGLLVPRNTIISLASPAQIRYQRCTGGRRVQKTKSRFHTGTRVRPNGLRKNRWRKRGDPTRERNEAGTALSEGQWADRRLPKPGPPFLYWGRLLRASLFGVDRGVRKGMGQSRGGTARWPGSS